jgi:hypothetical protein
MGQTACCENDPTDPALHYNAHRTITTPQKNRQSASSPKFTSPEKYQPSQIQPETSEYVKQKKRTLSKYIPKNTANVQGEPRAAHQILSSNVIYKG